MAAITQRMIGSLKPREKPYELRDDRLKGFIVRVQPSGRMSYIAEYRRGRRITLGPVGELTLGRARTLASDVLQAGFRGEPDEVIRTLVRGDSGAPTLREFIEEKLAPWVVANQRTGAATVARLRASFFPDLGERRLDELTPWLIEKWRTARLKAGRKHSTINRDLVALKSALARAVEWGVISSHPIAKVKLARVDPLARVRFLDEAEEARLRAALETREARLRERRASANAWREARSRALLEPLAGRFADHLAPMVLVTLNTGLRRGELLALRWTDVDLERALLTVQASSSKSGRRRDVPLNEEALEVLCAWREQQSGEGYVFPGRSGAQRTSIRKAWQALLEEARIEGFTWHDLRHHFASSLVMAGVPLNTVRDLLGHADMTATLRYAHLAPEAKASAVAQLDRRRGQGFAVKGVR